MDVSELMGNNVTKDVVVSSPSKKLVVLSAGAMKQMPDGKNKLNILVEMDGRQLNWIPNKTSMKNLAQKYSVQSEQWVGKPVQLEMGIVNGKEAIIGKPL